MGLTFPIVFGQVRGTPSPTIQRRFLEIEICYNQSFLIISEYLPPLSILRPTLVPPDTASNRELIIRPKEYDIHRVYTYVFVPY